MVPKISIEKMYGTVHQNGRSETLAEPKADSYCDERVYSEDRPIFATGAVRFYITGSFPEPVPF